MFFKKILFITLLFVAFKASAQNDILVKGDTLVLKDGARFWLGESVTLGSGSLADKSFFFIYEPEIPYLKKRKPLPGDFSGQTSVIKKFQRDGVYKGGYSYNIIVLEFNRRRYWCDVVGALTANELIDGSNGAGSSKEARLAKLKQLLDSNQITPDEYETLKAKILNTSAPGPPPPTQNTKPTPNTKKKANGPIVF